MTHFVCRELAIPGVLLLEPKVFGDQRGFFTETYHRDRYREAGISDTFVQDNCSLSLGGVLRGLHYQLRHAQAKLVWAVQGTIFDVVVDIRMGSPTFGKWVSCTLSEENHCQLYVPTGFAHGFCVLSEKAEVLYKCSDFYDPADDRGVSWCDPDIGINWPVSQPILSAKDSALRPLSGIPQAELPVYG